MGVISVRLNKNEDKMITQLSEYFHTDKSALVKKSLSELYENMLDIEKINAFEKKEKREKVSFTTAENILTKR